MKAKVKSYLDFVENTLAPDYQESYGEEKCPTSRTLWEGAGLIRELSEEVDKLKAKLKQKAKK